ncbi:DUF6301 family protein [Nocardia sp. NPDC050406]|uniref:DUF6301 family protein n=1 Tax=Nocardia sp. NPDC050406 TaxID=3364318 RepID=UPI00378B2E4A
MMSSDVAGAVRVARAAARYEWTWTRANLIRFCENLGWEASDTEDGVTVTTNLVVRKPTAMIYLDAAALADLEEFDQDLLEVVVIVARAESSETSAATQSCFTRIAAALSTTLGPGTHSYPSGEPAPAWDLEKVFIRLGMVPGLIGLYLVNPAYQASIDAFQDEHDIDD